MCDWANYKKTIACNEDLCEKGCDSYGDIVPYFDSVLDKEDI